VWKVEIDAALEILGELITAGLIELNKTSDRYHLHDLARVFADAKLDDEERILTHKRHAVHYMGLLSGIAELYLEGCESLLCGLALFDLEWNNIQAGQAWAAAKGNAANEAVARLCITYPGVGAEVLCLRLHSREQIRWLEAGLAAARRLKDPEGEGVVLGNLGLAYAHLGETRRALQFYEQQLAIVRELGDRMGEGIALGNIGLACDELGEPQRAMKFFEQRLTIAREMGDTKGQASALGHLGGACVSLNENRRAIQYFEQQLAIVREIGDLKGESIALGNLGIAHAVLNETQKAISYFEEQLAIARKMGDRVNEGIALWNMSLVLDRLGKRPQAIKLAEHALTIHEQIEDRNTMKVRVQLAAWRAETRHD
jgi:tetratricopeptide (TPR) repeat protein